MKLLKIITNPRVVTAFISAIGAIVSAICAGCKLYLGEMSIKDLSVEIVKNNETVNTNTNIIHEINND